MSEKRENLGCKAHSLVAVVDVSVDQLVKDSGGVRLLQWLVEIEAYSNYITTYTFGDDILSYQCPGHLGKSIGLI